MTTDTSHADAWRSYFSDRCREEIRRLAEAYPGERSLYVGLIDLYEYDPDLAEAVFDRPDRALREASEVLAGARDAFDRVHLRVQENPGLLLLEDVRARHIGELITVDCRVAAVEPVTATARTAAFECHRCGEVATERPDGLRLAPPVECPACGGGALGLDHERSTFIDSQRVTLESGPDAEPSVARTMPASLDDDLVGALAPGDSSLVTGVLRLEPTTTDGANRFEFLLDAVAVTEEASPRQQRSAKDVIQSRWRFLSDRDLNREREE